MAKKSVTVITPTTGSPKLIDAIVSVSNQNTEHDVRHLLVCDGLEYAENLEYVLCDVFRKYPQIEEKGILISLNHENTGADGFNGQRIYAAFPHLINSDYICFLDQDNWYRSDHVQSLVDLIESNNLDWAYSLRNIYTEEKDFLVTDHCESLGAWPIFFTYNTPTPQYLIDTSCFFFRKNFIQKTCHLWHSGPWGEDRRYLHAVKELGSNWKTTGLPTLCYRLNGNPNSVNVDLFLQGNEFYKQVYQRENNFPWVKKND